MAMTCRAGCIYPRDFDAGEEISDGRERSWRSGIGRAHRHGPIRMPTTWRLPPRAISCSCRIRAAASARAKPSRAPTSRISATATSATSSPASMRWCASAPIDPDRLGITGWSYGGYMTMWGVTQTNRFKAAMAGAGIANWQSYYGQNLIDQWMMPFFGASVYDDPAVYAKSSPITFIKNVKTPTLMLVGDSDARMPGAAVLRVLARAEDARCRNAARRLRA